MTPQRTLAVIGAGLCGGVLVCIAIPSLARSASTDCASAYDTYAALAAADGVFIDEAPAGLLPVYDADGGLPAAQARIGSLTGSVSWAGAPYSDAAAGNLGLTPVDANQVPVFVVSKYPTETKETKDYSGASLTATTDAEAAAASVIGGSPSGNAASVGRVATAATTVCEGQATLHSTADNSADVFDVGGVLRIASVSSHAEAILGSSSGPKLTGTMQIEGATVLGQAVGITDKGVVAGSSSTPLPDTSALTNALLDAGIGVHYVAAVQDPKNGTVIAPGLDITVTRAVQGVGTGESVTTYSLGRAFASVSNSSAGVSTPSTGTSTPVRGHKPVPPAAPVRSAGNVGGTVPPPTATTSVAPVPAPAVAAPSTPVAAQYGIFARWSIARVYIALSLAVALLALSSIGVHRLAGRRR